MDGNQIRWEVEMLKGRKMNFLRAALVAAFAVFVLGYQGGKHLAKKENATNSLTPEAPVIAVKDQPLPSR